MNGLRLSTLGATAIASDVEKHGALDVETGGFLLAAVGSDEVRTIAMSGSDGILRRSNLFQISAMALEALFAFADEGGLWIPAQYHSHGFVAEMSICDEDHGLMVPGFISAIVPDYSNPPAHPRSWGWWQFDRGWKRTGPPVDSDESISVVVFDKAGVSAA